ncbi:unnamed protein product [Meloidogyne enterolobii]|uniref:Uncharacterized protein n=1 Tax=Meloidogyne enterolobii TaxID=390850 RepID=A0ACB0XKA4_MELEN
MHPSLDIKFYPSESTVSNIPQTTKSNPLILLNSNFCCIFGAAGENFLNFGAQEAKFPPFSAPQAKILRILELKKPDFFHFSAPQAKFWEFWRLFLKNFNIKVRKVRVKFKKFPSLGV